MDLPDVAITDVATGGDGIGHAPDGRIVFVAGAVVGDRVDVEITDDKPRMLKGRVAGVRVPSPDRVAPPCPHVADGCGGCGWQHLDVGAQRRAKIRLATESLRRLGHIDGEVRRGPELPSAGYRNAVRMVVNGGRLGFRAMHSHDVVPIDTCLVAAPALNQLLAQRNDRRVAGSGDPVTERSSRSLPPGSAVGTATWAALADGTEVTLRVSEATGERLVVVDGPVPEAWEVPGATVVASDDLIPGEGPSLVERVAGVDFRVSAGSFFQTRTDGAQALVEVVRQLGGDAWGRGRLLDLYGGVGLFAGCLGDGMGVTLVESSPSSAADARHNLPAAHVVARRVERWTPSAQDREATVAVADPPRAGLHEGVVGTLAAIGPAALVVVHCDAASFGRDAGRLAAAGYRLDDTVLVDLFPHTPHVELVSRFSPV